MAPSTNTHAIAHSSASMQTMMFGTFRTSSHEPLDSVAPINAPACVSFGSRKWKYSSTPTMKPGIAQIQNTQRHDGTTCSSWLAMIGPSAKPMSAKPLCCKPLIEAAARGSRCGGDGREARRAIRALHRAHDRADPDERDEALHHAGEARHQREQDDRRDQHLAMTDRVGEAPGEDREHAPEDAENAGEPADLAFRQPQVRGHRRETTTR